MSHELAFVASDPTANTGWTVTAYIYSLDALIHGAIACPEGAPGIYRGDMPSGIAAGTYVVRFSKDGGATFLAPAGNLRWGGDAAGELAPIPGPPPAAGHGRVYLYSDQLGGDVRAGLTIEISLQTYPAKAGGRAIESAPYSFETDSTGLASTTIPLTPATTPVSQYLLTAADLKIKRKAFTLTADMLDGDGNFDLSTLIT